MLDPPDVDTISTAFFGLWSNNVHICATALSKMQMISKSKCKRFKQDAHGSSKIQTVCFYLMVEVVRQGSLTKDVRLPTSSHVQTDRPDDEGLHLVSAKQC